MYRYIYNVWTLNTATILCHVLTCQISFFEEAVIAVRLTELVLDADRRGEQLPPVVANPKDSASSRQLPSLVEQKAASELEHFVQAAVYMVL